MPMKTLSSENIYQGAVFTVTRDIITATTGQQITREVIQHPGGAGGIALFDDGRIALVKQYRHPAQDFLLEIPAGKIDEGESPEECALREIEEELGYQAGKIEKLAEFYSTPGFCAEKLHVYLATELVPTAQKLDHDEEVEIIFMPLAKAFALAHAGHISDAKTIIALLLLQQKLAAQESQT